MTNAAMVAVQILIVTNWSSVGVFNASDGKVYDVRAGRVVTNQVVSTEQASFVIRSDTGPEIPHLLLVPVVSSGTHTNPPPLPTPVRFVYPQTPPQQ